jgi:predicted lipase
VGSLTQSYPDASVTAVGFSLGGAIALLDGLLLRMLLDPNTEVRVVTYGMPRVGNQEFASTVDALLAHSVKHIGNKRDPVPIVPAISLGYNQVSGEIHIEDSGKWIQIPGGDNGDPRAIAGTVTSINDANFADHTGPYNGVSIGCPAPGPGN